MAATIKCDTIQNASSATVNAYLDGNGNLSVGNSTSPSATSTGNINASGTVAMGSSFLRNRIINGDMRIDQRNAGASVTPTSGPFYTLDRFIAGLTQSSKYSVQQNAGSVTPPVGFTNYLGCTSLSAFSVSSTDTFFIQQRIEGLNVADLAWGSANAKTVTLSFWVFSSLTGTFGGSILNAAANRSYPFSYSISSANTWTYITITVPGDTSGTWLTTDGIGLRVTFSLGTGSTLSTTAGTWAAGNYLSATGATSVVGTNGATFYLTGVQLEVGSVATAFERRQYGQELALCQRYYYKIDGSVNTNYPLITAYQTTGSTAYAWLTFPVTMRASPTPTKIGTWTTSNSGQPTFFGNPNGARVDFVITSTGSGLVYPAASAGASFDAEL